MKGLAAKFPLILGLALWAGTAQAAVPRQYAVPEIVSTAALVAIAVAGLLVFRKRMKK